MPIAIIFLFVAGSLAVAILYPHLRVIAFAILLVFGAIFGVYILTNESEVDRAASRIPVEDLTLTDLELTYEPRFSAISGRVLNKSDQYRLRSFDIQVTLYDCDTAEQALESCAIIAEDSGPARMDVPPGQTRNFRGVLDLRTETVAKNVSRWDYQILNITATP